jgi:hypothetical protein
MLPSASTLHILFWISVAISVLGTIALPIVLVRIPSDYFVRKKPTLTAAERWHIAKVAMDVLRNTVAVVFLLAGLVMLFTPGQGLLMLLAALWIATFPGKTRLERRIVLLPGVLAVVNKIRSKAGALPLQSPTS